MEVFRGLLFALPISAAIWSTLWGVYNAAYWLVLRWWGW